MNGKTAGRLIVWIYFIAVILLGFCYWSRPVRSDQFELAVSQWTGIFSLRAADGLYSSNK
jgi:hypothetical protein